MHLSLVRYVLFPNSQFIQSLEAEKTTVNLNRMGEDKDVLLEEDSYRIIEMDNRLQESDPGQPDIEVEIVNIEERSPYSFLQNCNFVGLWMCVLYNFCMISIVVIIFIYKRWN
ncbi:uncharacterized protein LOC108033584 [Drosophila biarmipes]|uniref:uncharacterized protein LOC108033584 n=1 Tax=Drosophila biarmipes TaxID=125945 RepID=UPI0007E83EAD|nr:uncharacterized protein LOC108033584 [Drosophila biarmipes]